MEEAINNIYAEEPSITALAIIVNNQIYWQTDNWDLSPNISQILSIWTMGGGGSINISNVKYIVLSADEYILTATNVQGQGHIIGCSCKSGKLIGYVGPDGDARGAMVTLQKYAIYI